MKENTNNLEVLDNITKELEKNSKYSYSYISKKKKEGKVTIFFFNSFLITITNDIIHMHQYNKLLYIINNKKNFIIGIPNHTLLINKDEIEKELYSYLLDLQKDYKLIENTIEYDESEKDNIWNKLDSCIKNYKIKTYNMIDEESLKIYFETKRMKRKAIINMLIISVIFAIPLIIVNYYILKWNIFYCLFLYYIGYAFSIYNNNSYEKYTNNCIKKIIKMNTKGNIYINDNHILLKLTTDIIILKKNRYIYFYNNKHYYYIEYQYYPKIIIIKKEKLTSKDKSYIEKIFYNK